MHSVRSTRSYYVAAFILGALIALLIATPVRSAETFRENRDPVDGEAWLEIHRVAADAFTLYGALQ